MRSLNQKSQSLQPTLLTLAHTSRSSLTAQAGRPGIGLQTVSFADRSPAFRPGLLRTLKSRSGKSGFTLVELLVVIGIIALLLGISLVGVNIAKKRAQRIRTTDDLHMIEIALDAYRSDFQDYPRFADPSVDLATQNVTPNGTWLDYRSDRGARLLCRALISPGPAGNNYNAKIGEDGADGPGFRIRRTIIGATGTGTLSGKVYGPYLAADKFKLEFTSSSLASDSAFNSNMGDAKILDPYGNPILYFPALPGPPVISQPANGLAATPPEGYYVGKQVPANYNFATSVKPLYNAFDNTQDTTADPNLSPTAIRYLLDPKQMQYLLGNISTTGSIAAGETALTTQPYLLWTAGADGQFGFGIDPSTGAPRVPTAQLKTDDVANFEFPAGMRK